MHHARNGFLTRKGYQLSLEGLAQKDSCGPLSPLGVDEHPDQLYLDNRVSVSALVEVEGSHVFDERLIDSQYRRFLNGS